MDKLEIAKKYFRYKRQDETTWQYALGRNLTKTVVEIPARSGSTRIKNKNIKDVLGQPLIAFTIKFALQLKNVDRVIVNTDSAEYADIARQYGAEVPFLRPAEFAAEKSSLSYSTFYLKRFLMDEEYPTKKIVTLLPTSPFRNKRTVEGLIEKLDTNYTVCSAFRTAMNLSGVFLKNGGKHLSRLNESEGSDKQFFIKKIGMFSGVNLHTGHGMRSFVYNTVSPFELIDIDTEEDMYVMKQVLENNLYDFGCKI